MWFSNLRYLFITYLTTDSVVYGFSTIPKFLLLLTSRGKNNLIGVISKMLSAHEVTAFRFTLY